MWLRRRRRRRRCHFFLLCPPYGERQEAASLSHILEMLSISPSLRPPKLASGQNGGPLFPPPSPLFEAEGGMVVINHAGSEENGRKGRTKQTENKRTLLYIRHGREGKESEAPRTKEFF